MDELGRAPFGKVQFVLEVAESRSPGGHQAAPRRAKHVSCWTVQSAGASGGWMSDGQGVAGIYSHFVEFNLRPLSSCPL